MTQLSPRLTLALQIADEAADIILDWFQSDRLQVELKADQSPVTAADRAAEDHLRSRIIEAFPDDGILGEERDDKPSQNGFRWILDPIDGTKSFMYGVPLFGTLIAVEQTDSEGDRRPMIGVCRLPALQEVVYAERGRGAWWQQRDAAPVRAQVSTCAELSQAMFCYTSIRGFEKTGRMRQFNTVRANTLYSRGWCDCYGHVLVATGRADVMIDPEMSLWDNAALAPIVEEAGGRFLDWSGDATVYSGDGISVNAALANAVTALVCN